MQKRFENVCAPSKMPSAYALVSRNKPNTKIKILFFILFTNRTIPFFAIYCFKRNTFKKFRTKFGKSDETSDVLWLGAVERFVWLNQL